MTVPVFLNFHDLLVIDTGDSLKRNEIDSSKILLSEYF